MVAVPGAHAPDPVPGLNGRPVVPLHGRRVVAAAVSPMELLRPASDLARLIEGFVHVDLLVASEDYPLLDDELDADDGDDECADEPDDLRVAADQLGLPGLHLHRLGLRPPLGPRAEGTLVAALSELVGFDPEPGVYCLAPVPPLPAPTPSRDSPYGQGVDPSRAVLHLAMQRIAQVYGIPLLRYRCLELAVVGADSQP